MTFKTIQAASQAYSIVLAQQDPAQLLHTTVTCISAAALHRSAEKPPHLREYHREVTNAKIHDRNRATREIVVAMPSILRVY